MAQRAVMVLGALPEGGLQVTAGGTVTAGWHSVIWRQGSQLGLTVYHVCEPENRQDLIEAVYEQSRHDGMVSTLTISLAR